MQKVKLTAARQRFHAMSGEIVGMFTAGIVEPFEVTYSALQNAALIGSLILITTETIVADKLEPKSAAGAPGGGGMGGGYDMM